MYSSVSYLSLASQVAPGVKNPPTGAEDVRDTGSTPGLGRPPGGGHGNPFQDSCLESPTDRGAWRVTVHGAAKSWTPLGDWTARLQRTETGVRRALAAAARGLRRVAARKHLHLSETLAGWSGLGPTSWTPAGLPWEISMQRFGTVLKKGVSDWEASLNSDI